MNAMVNILFLCTGNSCRSQMAEGWTRQIHGDRMTVHSAGILKTAVNTPRNHCNGRNRRRHFGQYSKKIDDVMQIPFDYVVTVCSHAHETCPVFPAKATVLHRGFDDPPSLTAQMADGEAKLNVYRRVRDEIRAFVETLPDFLLAPEEEVHHD